GRRRRSFPRASGDPRPGSVPGPQGVSQGPLGRHEAGYAREVSRPGEALLRGAGQMSRITLRSPKLVWMAVLLLASAAPAQDPYAEAKARLQAVDEALSDSDLATAKQELAQARQLISERVDT